MQLAQNEPLLGKADIFALAFKNRSLQFPLTVTWDYYPITEHRLASTPEQSFDAGENPQPGQVWNPNLSIDVEGITLTLKEITVERGNSYRFTFEGPGNLAGVSVEMPDYDSLAEAAERAVIRTGWLQRSPCQHRLCQSPDRQARLPCDRRFALRRRGQPQPNLGTQYAHARRPSRRPAQAHAWLVP